MTILMRGSSVRERRTRTLALLATASVALAGISLSCGRTQRGNDVNIASFRIDDRDRYYRLGADQESDCPLIPAIAAQVSTDFVCPVAQVKVRLSEFDRRVMSSEGCGKQGVYLRVDRMDSTTHLGRYEGQRVGLRTVRFVLLSDGDVTSHLQDLGRTDLSDEGEPWYVPEVRDAADPVTRLTHALQNWANLLQQGARDLHCPPSESLPGFAHGTRANDVPVVEGCGKRATYLPGLKPPYRISSVVETMP